MKTICVNTYKFSELSDKAKEKAIEKHREFIYECGFAWADESIESLKKGIDAFGCSIGRYEIDFCSAARSYVPFSIPDGCSDISGVRLYKYILNNYGYVLTEKKVFRMNNLSRKSKIQKIATCCPFTGYCLDESFLKPIRKFMARPDSGTTFSDLIESAIEEALHDIQEDCEYQVSDDAIIESIECNDYDFLESGKLA